MFRIKFSFLIIGLITFSSFAGGGGETTGSSPTPILGLRKVVIDAGHGGKDAGCLGTSSKEKDVALSVALKLGDFIERYYSDVEVIYTRKTDVFIELHERAKIANDAKADLFICVHANANPSKQAYGSETYVMGLHKSEANLNVAKRENSSILMEDDYEVTYDGFDPNTDESYIAFSLMQSAFLEQSLSFATKVQAQFKGLGRRNRGVKQAGFLVLYKTTMPSVLIETGFLTNNEEENFLKSTTNQSKMASSIFEAFKTYKSEIDSRVLVGDEGKLEEIPKQDASQVVIEVTEVAEESEAMGVAELKKTTTLIETQSEEKEVIVEVPKKMDPVAEGVLYRVQITSSPTSLGTDSKDFAALEHVWEYTAGSMFKYTAGRSTDLDEIVNVQNLAREKGYKDAFVVAFNNGTRITIGEAKKMLAR